MPPLLPFAPPASRVRSDARRFGAYIIDLALMYVAIIIATGGVAVTLRVCLLLGAFQLSYFFLCEALTGQTVGKRLLGLRVTRSDGSAASAGAVATRTVFRLLDHTLLGPMVMLATGRRRRRLGDLVARTAVVPAHPAPAHPRRSPLLALFPVALVVAAVLLTDGHDLYLSRVDRVCHWRHDWEAGLGQPVNPATVVGLQQRQWQEIGRIDATRHPDEARRVDDIHREWQRVATQSAAGLPELAAATAQARRRFAALDLEACAPLGP